MITEDYVSFETAKLLKEKGFKKWCYMCYGTAVCHKGVPISFDEECELESDGLGDEIEYVEGGHLYNFGCDNREKETKVWAAPTLHQVIKWIEEESEHIIYTYPIYDGKFIEWKYNIWFDNSYMFMGQILEFGTDNVFKTREEACEAAIKYCLENLI